MFCNMLNQLLKNPEVKTLQSIGPIELVKHTLIKPQQYCLVFDFRHRPVIYHNRKNMKRDVKVKLDFTKKRYSILLR